MLEDKDLIAIDDILKNFALFKGVTIYENGKEGINRILYRMDNKLQKIWKIYRNYPNEHNYSIWICISSGKRAKEKKIVDNLIKIGAIPEGATHSILDNSFQITVRVER